MSKDYDIVCENFDQYFVKQITQFGPHQKNNLPTHLVKRLYKMGGELNMRSISQMNIAEKMYVLSAAGAKRIYLAIEDFESGMTEDDFISFNKDQKNKVKAVADHADKLVRASTFILTDRQVSDTLTYINTSNLSAAYNYAIKSRNVKKSAIERRKYYSQVFSLLTQYENSKGKWERMFGITNIEFLVLIALYHGNPVQGKVIYKDTYGGAFSRNGGRMRHAFSSLRYKGLISKTGSTKKALMQITMLGTTKIEEILRNHVLRTI